MFGHNCILCAGPATARDLCAACAADLPWTGSACATCARPIPHGRRCGPCLRRAPPQDATLAPLRYAFPVDRLILALKFAGRLPCGRVLGEVLAEHVVESRCENAATPTPWPDFIVPVPLHPQRLRERGFNQAAEIARPVSKALRIPLRTRWCTRVRATPPQSGLEGKARRRNVRGAFAADARVAGLHVAVVDDVYTTGGTIAAVATALRRAGAVRVDAWCVARAGSG